MIFFRAMMILCFVTVPVQVTAAAFGPAQSAVVTPLFRLDGPVAGGKRRRREDMHRR